MNQQAGEEGRDSILQLSAEELVVSKRPTSERVVVRRETRSREVKVDEVLASESVVVERVPIGRYVDAVPAVREEGDCTILPVVEEVAVVVRRLLLREEVRLRRVKTSSHHVETVTLREQHVVVSRSPAEGPVKPGPVANPEIAEPVPVQPEQTRSLTMSEETIVAVFDSAAHADAAIADLKAARVPDSAISRHAEDGSGSTGTMTSGTTAAPAREQGFWSSLFGGASSDEPVYDRSLATGGSVVVVKAPMNEADAIVTILERHHPIDLDERAGSYGVGAQPTSGMATSGMATSGMATSGMATTGMAGTTNAAPADQGRMSGVTAADGVLSLSEESLAVGKRLVNQGGTRIRRYVVERPAEADVTLRSETVQVERRPVTGAALDAGDFSDKTIEMTASGEEAVIGKTSRVVEEVALHKEASERTETVHDTVRRQEVEVEQVPSTETMATPAANRTTP